MTEIVTKHPVDRSEAWWDHFPKIPLSDEDRALLDKVKWVTVVPHPDGGTQDLFGLDMIERPVNGGLECIRLFRGIPERFLIPHDPALLGTSWGDGFSNLKFDKLRLHRPLVVYLESPTGVIDPINPDRINEIGGFVVEADMTMMQDRESRKVVQTQKDLLALYHGYIESGIMDPDDELAQKIIENASVHLKLLEETREELPDRVRALVPKSEQLGVLLIDEPYTTRGGLSFDPELIVAIYTSETDTLGDKDFGEHRMNIIHDMKALDLHRIAAARAK